MIRSKIVSKLLFFAPLIFYTIGETSIIKHLVLNYSNFAANIKLEIKNSKLSKDKIQTV